MTPDAAPPAATPHGRTNPFHVVFPERESGSTSQDHEWCHVRIDGEMQRIRFHDYHAIYAIPGLYEHLFYDRLECVSPETVCGLLADELKAAAVSPGALRVLDLGAGNGMVGEELQRLGAGSIVGVDLIPEAGEAAARDRPGVYDDYIVCDLTAPSAAQRSALFDGDFNCLVTVAALGFGDIPPEVFTAAYDLIATGGWLAFNIKEDFLADGDGSGFSRLIADLVERGIVEECARKSYRHRLSAAGDALTYVALVARKRGEIPRELLAR